MENITAKICNSSEEEKAMKEIIQLINEQNLSFAETRGAAWEAILMLMHKPVRFERNPQNKDKKIGVPKKIKDFLEQQIQHKA